MPILVRSTSHYRRTLKFIMELQFDQHRWFILKTSHLITFRNQECSPRFLENNPESSWEETASYEAERQGPAPTVQILINKFSFRGAHHVKATTICLFQLIFWCTGWPYAPWTQGTGPCMVSWPFALCFISQSIWIQFKIFCLHW